VLHALMMIKRTSEFVANGLPSLTVSPSAKPNWPLHRADILRLIGYIKSRFNTGFFYARLEGLNFRGEIECLQALFKI
jgi:hypothetical protein